MCNIREFIILFRKIALSVVCVFMANLSSTASASQILQSKYEQGLVALLLFTISLILQTTNQPYYDPEVNVLETFSLVVGLFTL